VQGQAQAVCAEGVGLDQLGARDQVLAVQALDERWLGDVQLVEAALVRHAALVEQRAERTIGQQRGALQAVEERGVGHRLTCNSSLHGLPVTEW
jgi:hypothetical protein